MSRSFRSANEPGGPYTPGGGFMPCHLSTSSRAARPSRIVRLFEIFTIFAILCAPALVLAHEPGEEDDDHKPVPARTAPVLLERAEPIYPELARKDGIGGTV